MAANPQTWSRQQRRYREILAEIRSELSGASYRGTPSLLEAYERIKSFRKTAPIFFSRDAIQKTRDDARSIVRSIDELTSRLHSEHLSPELRVLLRLETKGAREHLAHLPGSQLTDALKAVREICQTADERQPSYDPVRRWCAMAAHGLLVRFGGQIASSGAMAGLRLVASRMYEILTGEADCDLRRACEEHVKGVNAKLRNARIEALK